MSVFNSFKLTEIDELNGSVLSSIQKQVIQNRICILATELVDLPILNVDKTTYFDKLSFLKGQISELRAQLEASDSAEIALQTNTQ